MDEQLQLDPDSTAVLVIDMQNDFLLEGAPLEMEMGREFIPELSAFLDRSREAGVPVVFTRQVNSAHDFGGLGDSHTVLEEEKICWEGTEGAEIHDDLTPKPEDISITKPRYDAFWGTPMDNILRSLDVKNVVITGVSSTGCCFDTARGALKREYNVIYPPDLTGTYQYDDFGFGEKTPHELHEAVCTIVGQTTGSPVNSENLRYS